MDIEMLCQTGQSGVYTLAPDCQPEFDIAASQAGLLQLHADLKHCRNSRSALTKLGHDLGFPDWYGANFDALNDCLSDPDWHPQPALVVHLRGLETLRSADVEGFATLIEVLQTAAEARRTQGCALWLLVDTPARGVLPLPRA